jgi:osmotically-inducible protein OsmY
MNNRYDRDRDDERERSERSWQQGDRPRGQSYRDSDWRERFHGEPAQQRGVYRERVWTRDPTSGNVYGYENDRRVGGQHFNEGDESRDSWRSAEPRSREHDAQWRANQINRSPENYRNWYPAGLPSQYGKGPKGYTRSDARIREDVCDRLTDDDQVDASDITVTVKDAEVTLEGSVSDRHIKHRAEDITAAVSGVRDVTNRLRARKGIFAELGDKIKGDDESEHRGHRGEGPRGKVANGEQGSSVR